MFNDLPALNPSEEARKHTMTGMCRQKNVLKIMTWETEILRITIDAKNMICRSLYLKDGRMEF